MIPLEPSDELLAAWLAGDLADPEDAAVTAAVARDPAVAARADALADLLTALAVAGAPPPPTSLAGHLNPAVLAALAAAREAAEATAPLPPAATARFSAEELAMGAAAAGAARDTTAPLPHDVATAGAPPEDAARDATAVLPHDEAAAGAGVAVGARAAGRGPRAGRPPAGPGAAGGAAGVRAGRQRRMQQWLSGLAVVALLVVTTAVVVRTRGEGFGTAEVATEAAEAGGTEEATGGDVPTPSEALEAVTGDAGSESPSPSPMPSPTVLAVPTPSVSPTRPAPAPSPPAPAPPPAAPTPPAPPPPAPPPAPVPPPPAPAPPPPAPAPPPPAPAPPPPAPPTDDTSGGEEIQPQPSGPAEEPSGPTPTPQPSPAPSPSEDAAGDGPVASESTPDPDADAGAQPGVQAPQTSPTIRDAMADLPDRDAVRSYFGGRPEAEQLLGLQEDEAEERADQHAAIVRDAPDFASGTAPAACLNAALGGQSTAVIAAVESVVYNGVDGIGYLVVRGAPQLAAIDVTVFDLSCAPLAYEQL